MRLRYINCQCNLEIFLTDKLLQIMIYWKQNIFKNVMCLNDEHIPLKVNK